MSAKSHYLTLDMTRRGERSVSYGCDHSSEGAQACDTVNTLRTMETNPLRPGTWHFLRDGLPGYTQREWGHSFEKKNGLCAPPG